MFLDDYEIPVNELRTISPWGNAICYSGYRTNQKPGGPYPTYEQVYADLIILTNQWKYIRMYDTGPHCETVLKVIHDYNLPLKVYMGVAVGYPASSWTERFRTVSNYPAQCWVNDTNQITNLFRLYNLYSNHIVAVSVGNECLVDWSDHQVPGPILFSYLKWVRSNVSVPVTVDEDIGYWALDNNFAQNGKYWTNIIKACDFVAIHLYPCKIGKWVPKLSNTTEAFIYTTNTYYKMVAKSLSNRQVVIGEGGWATGGTFEGVVNTNLLCETNQKTHYNDIVSWASNNNVLYFWFEAFDEYWKGSANSIEIYWGLFFDYGGTNRVAKYAMYDYYTNCQYDISIPWLSSWSNLIDTNRPPKW
jgi:exo-beta-1,3-glucanase (GH17 family)